VEEPRGSEPAADVFAPAESDAAAPDDDVTATTTMADLYVRQGLIDEARKIYEHMLQRDPSDEEVRVKLDALNERGAELPGEQVTESPEEQVAESPAVGSEPATGQPGNLATESTIEPAREESPRQPGNPATLHRHAKVVALDQWLARVSRRGPSGA
jgi:pentatricopeptide repeat protein